jgi:hypothetical protein
MSSVDVLVSIKRGKVYLETLAFFLGTSPGINLPRFPYIYQLKAKMLAIVIELPVGRFPRALK